MAPQNKHENLKWEHEVLEQRYRKVAAERDSLYEKFHAGMCICDWREIERERESACAGHCRDYSFVGSGNDMLPPSPCLALSVVQRFMM